MSGRAQSRPITNLSTALEETEITIMRYFISFIICLVLISVSSCRKDFNTIPSSGALEFSKDTVFLDTVFTNIGSATYNLKVYNRGKNAITIPEIKLENGTILTTG